MREPENIRPVESKVSVPGREWKHTVPALTIEVVDLPF